MTNQTQRILTHLQRIGPITPLEALQNYGCFRLGARIWDLKQAGHNIRTNTIKQGRKHFACYELAEVGE